MENGLVSQHAYTVTGAETVSLPWAGPRVLAPQNRSQNHMPSTPSKAEMSVYCPYPMVAPTMDCILPSVHPEVASIFIPSGPTRDPAILEVISHRVSLWLDWGITPKESGMN